jgi:glycosyltransferase involved in cell wall biosynthesis
MAVSTAAVSRATAEAARAIGMARVTHFYNGVELAPLPRRQSSSNLRLLAVSQLARWKGLHHVLAALAVARDNGLAVSLDVVGDAVFGDEGYREELRGRATELGLESCVRWHGHQAALESFYAGADVLLHLPEAPDPLPTVVLEAQSWGLPVIARKLGGIGEIVADGETGFLVDSPDPAEVARQIARVAHEGVRRELGAAARERVERLFSLTQYVDAFDEWLAAIRRQSRRGKVAARAVGPSA